MDGSDIIVSFPNIQPTNLGVSVPSALRASDIGTLEFPETSEVVTLVAVPVSVDETSGEASVFDVRIKFDEPGMVSEVYVMLLDSQNDIVSQMVSKNNKRYHNGG